jgi:hypothetical protein
VDAGDQDAEGGRVRAKGKGKVKKNQTGEGGAKISLLLPLRLSLLYKMEAV